MAENISSTVLFHFTKSMENLKSILKHGFYPRYCPEYTLDPSDRRAASVNRPPMRAVPMVYFCDLPLSLIRKHLGAYGHYGIGLTKEWGMQNSVTPVIYTHPSSPTLLSMLRLNISSDTNNDASSVNDSRRLIAYTKPTIGKAWRNDMVQEKEVPFYDERDWRYVPDVPWLKSPFLNHEEYSDDSKKTHLHEAFRTKCPLHIHADDIQYLVLPDEPDETNILELAKFLNTLYTPDDAMLVTTTIMTVGCIHEDV
jgi:Putative abortive phage resistance protein AbiGi, antitoxin